jgi:predicted RNA-binding Zn ribbon-like protein
LDFLNSIATPAETPVEWLASGDDLLEWLRRAELIPKDAAAALREAALPGELDAVAAQARALREWFRGFVHKRKGRPLGPKALGELEPLNQLLARDEEFGQIVARDIEGRPKDKGVHLSLRLTQERRWRSPDSLLLPIATALADLICNENFAQIKACEGSACSLLYLDRTPTRARRWCSMAVCGNREKQAAHRIRMSKKRRERRRRTRD